eukprot:365171-Chlamydomonas_euryale.AAC.18
MAAAYGNSAQTVVQDKTRHRHYAGSLRWKECIANASTAEAGPDCVERTPQTAQAHAPHRSSLTSIKCTPRLVDARTMSPMLAPNAASSNSG